MALGEKMNLILTMAGKYQRFIDEGYKLPKYLLPWGRRTILSSIINELDIFDNVFLIANKRDEIYAPHIKDIMKNKRIPIDHLFFIEDTSSQTETAYIALNKISSKKPIAFHNIDTILYNRDFSTLNDTLNNYDGVIDVFKSSNHKYSYVLLENGIVKTIREKMVISQYATSGFYAFSSPEIFKKYYNNQKYISNLYSDMINEGCIIVTTELHTEKDTVVLGTPSEYLTKSYLLDLKE